MNFDVPPVIVNGNSLEEEKENLVCKQNFETLTKLLLCGINSRRPQKMKKRGTIYVDVLLKIYKLIKHGKLFHFHSKIPVIIAVSK